MIFHGVRARTATGTPPFGQSVTSGVFTPIAYATNVFDTDGFHPILTDANLTGTVSKTGGNTTVTGTGTSFTTELAVGYPVRIPGGSQTDIVIVASVADNTHFACYTAPVGSASGQTGVKDSTVFVARITGYYAMHLWSNFGASATGIRESYVWQNNVQASPSTPTYEYMFQTATPSGEWADVLPAGPIHFNVGDFFQHVVYQNSGGPLLFESDQVGPALSLWLVGT